MSDPGDLRQELAFERWWDRMVRGTTDRQDPPLDPGLEAFARRVHALDDQPAADPAYTRHLWEDLMRSDAIPYLRPIALGSVVPNGRVRSTGDLPIPDRRTAVGRPGRSPRILVAAAILLALGVAAREFAPDDDAGRLAGIPAVVLQDSSPSPAGATDEEILAEVTLPADMLPNDATVSITSAIVTIPAGATEPLTRTSGTPGYAMMVVLEGSATFRPDVDAHAFLIPAGGVIEPVPADGVVTLRVGDTVVHREGTDWRLIPTGAGPTVILSSWIVEGVSIQIDLSDWAYGYDDLDSVNDVTLPAGPYAFRFRRVTLDGGATLPPVSAIVQLAVASPAGSVTLAKQGDYTVRNLGRETAAFYVVSLGPAEPGAGAGVVVAGIPATPVAATPSP